MWSHNERLLSKPFSLYLNTAMQVKSKCGCFNDWKSAIPPTSSKRHIGSSALCILINVDSHYSKCIHLLDWFDHKNQICLVSELLSMCLYDFLKENDFQVFPRRHIREFTCQLLGSVACKLLYLTSPCVTACWCLAFNHSFTQVTLVHADLKPENILLVDNSSRSVEYYPANRVYNSQFGTVDIRTNNFALTQCSGPW